MSNKPNKLILFNVRSCYNVGALSRTAESFGISNVTCLGTTPYPTLKDDGRLPHISKRATEQIHKTALGAEKHISYEVPSEEPKIYLESLKEDGYTLYALEQADDSTLIQNIQPSKQWALIVGEERFGIPKDILDMSHEVLEIEHLGRKESLNVSVAGSIALFALTKRPDTNQ